MHVKRFLLAALLAALPLYAQEKMSLENRMSPAPSGTQYAVPYATTTTAIGWLAHATGLQCLTQNGAAAPAWASCSAGSGTVTSVGSGAIGALLQVSWATATTTPALSLNLAAQAANCFIGGPTSGGSAVPTCRAIGTGDVPTLNQDTSGKAAKADALSTTGAPVNVSGSAPPAGSGYVCLTTDATHCTWQASGAGSVTAITANAPLTGGTITGSGSIGCATAVASGTSHAAGCVPDPGPTAGSLKFLREDMTYVTPAGGAGLSSPLTTKGDIWGYTTIEARIPVGTNGQMPMADSTAATGLSYQYPGIGTLHTLKETIFAGITPASYADGSTTTIDGSGYTAVVPTGGAADIVAAGLRLRLGTTSGANFTSMDIASGATGDFTSIVGEPRYRRGRWAMWVRLASYDYTNASTYARGMYEVANSRLGVRLMRTKNYLGSPATATGGLAYDYWWNGSIQSTSSYSSIGVSSADVWMAYFRTPYVADIYIGTYSSGWPTMESMTLVGTFWMPGSTAFLAGSSSGMTTAGFHIQFLLGDAAATTGTYEIVFDRWRLTTWE
jgi:hypothetical protein